ncbi:MAG: isoprenylcysteine carboxylmethyltransferase family protein [Pyrinomonadaceae bacterium]
MEQLSYYVSAAAFILVIALWFLFGGVFLLRKKPEATTDGAKIPRSFVGLALQGLGYVPIWFMRRQPVFSEYFAGQYVLNIVLQVLAVALAAFSVWFAMSAVRELGKQWSLEARLVEGHKLITSGVYQTVRHPIYTAMLGMLIATGIAYSSWLPTLIGIVVFIIGTKIRTVFEERLLGDAFGAEFTNWKAKVPGLIPFVKI